VALVGDRGMITSARITEELAPAGLDWQEQAFALLGVPPPRVQ
jgi:hypothetical protein